MSDVDEDKPEDKMEASGLAASRSKRSRGAKKASRMEELNALKNSRATGKRKWEDDEEIQNVYDVVDDNEYSELVSKRQHDDWIVDDDGGYVEDGREIFDEEMGDEMKGHRSSAGNKKATGKSNHLRRKADANATAEDSASSTGGKSIKNMILNMGASSKKKAEANLQNDAVLGELLGQIKSSTKSEAAKKPVTMHQQQQRPLSSAKPHQNPFAVRPTSTGLKKVVKKEEPAPVPIVDDGPLSQLIEEEPEFESAIDEPTPTQIIDDDIEEEEPEEEVKPENRGFKAGEEAKISELPKGWSIKAISEPEANVEVKLDPGKLPLIKNEAGIKVLRMFWLDAFEDQYKHPGTVWIFGKVFIESSNAYVSCCLTVKNIERQVFLLKNEDADMASVYAEFNEKITPKFKIAEFKSRPAEKNYAFEHAEVPDVAEYLEVIYSPKYPALPTDLKGQTFSRVFGANQSSLERFLLDRKIKGPSWIDVKNVTVSEAGMSWCKLEAVCENPLHISVCNVNPPPVPPLTIMAFNMKTTINPKTHQNEVSLFSGLVHHKFYVDRSAPKVPYTEHFCGLTRPSDEVWPFDFAKVLASNNATNAKVDKMDSERALLGFVMAKIGKIDPDVIIGHDIFGFDIEVLLHRTMVNKIPNWSRIGRLRRSQPMKGRVATTGRLVCDLKISAKELIRCKSYELGPLVEKLLGKAQEGRLEVDVEAMRKAYGSSKALLQATSVSLQEAADTLQCICELNALPLALQITQVAGNVMSRTLLGGRAERNEFLLLHAFHEKNYIVPDKSYGNKKKGMVTEDGDPEEQLPKGRRKPAYAGGLVLEPKKGFYDNFILLMDFNSLYPSIIQEYNICFTTVSRTKPKEGADDYIPDLPEDALPGILPTEIRKLVESRRSVKNLLNNPDLSEDLRLQYDIRQKALKLTANSMYGCLGFSFSRFYAKPLAALVTSRGREILLQTKNLVEKMNLEVIYGDTDSIMINSNSVDYDEVFKLGAQIKQMVNKTYKLLELDVDGVYRYMLLLKKKKYAAVTVEKKANGKLVETTELKGLDIVRRDWCQLAANAGKEILSRILSDCSGDDRVAFIHETLEKIASNLRDGKVGLPDLAITKSLTKDPNDYPDKKSLPHVQVALRMNSKGGKKLRAGDTVQYVICDDGSQLAATQRAFHVDEVKENEALKIDINYYLAQQLHPVVSRLCDPLEGTDASRIAQCLGLDPEQYRRSIRTENHHDDETAIKDEDRFRQCEKFQIECDCGEKIVLDSISRGSGKDLKLALLECPQPSCQKSPLLEKSGLIVNKLTLAIRNHIQKYYAGWIICEDPGCTGRTRRLPLSFQRAFPVCNTCFKATMYSEYTGSQLYTQLLYFQTLFNLSKFTDAHPDYLKMKSDHLRKEIEACYTKAYELVDANLKSNKYCMVSLNKVFEGLYPVTTEDRKKLK